MSRETMKRSVLRLTYEAPDGQVIEARVVTYGQDLRTLPVDQAQEFLRVSSEDLAETLIDNLGRSKPARRRRSAAAPVETTGNGGGDDQPR